MPKEIIIKPEAGQEVVVNPVGDLKIAKINRSKTRLQARVTVEGVYVDPEPPPVEPPPVEPPPEPPPVEPPPLDFTMTIADGDVLTGTVQWVATETVGTLAGAQFYIDSGLHWDEHFVPWGGALETTAYPDGTHDFTVIGQNAAGAEVTHTATATIDNTVVEPPPPPPTTGIYGSGIMSDGKDNRPVGRSDNSHFAARWVSAGGHITGIGFNQRTAPDRSDPGQGYSHGDGGLMRISLQGVKADGMPDGVHKHAITYQPVNPHIDDNENRTIIPFDTIAPAGTLCIVWDNIHADPTNNWESINCLYHPSDTQPGTDAVALERANFTGGNWRQVGNNTPTFVVQFADHPNEGQGYSQIVAYTNLDGTGQYSGFAMSGTRKVRQRFTISGPLSVKAVWLRAKRLSGTGDLIATLNGVTAIASVSNIPQTTKTNLNGSEWVRVPLVVSLPAGEHKAEFSTTAELDIMPIRRDGWEGNGWKIPYTVGRSEKSFNGGSTWADLYNHATDLQWYLEL